VGATAGLSSSALAQRVLAHTLDTLLRLLHPMIPFLTEDVWQRLAQVAPSRGIDNIGKAAESIMIAPWPEFDAKRQNAEIEAQFAQYREVLRAIRDIRMRQNVPLKTRLEFSVRCGEETVALLKPMDECFLSMAGAEATAMGPEVTPPALSATTSLSSTFSYIAKGGIKISGSAEVYVNLAGLIDMEAEVARKKQEIEKLAGFIASKQKKLENKNFVDRAPPEVVQKERDSLDDLQSQYESAKAVVGQLLKSNKTP